MKIERILPAPGEIDVADLLRALQASAGLPPFDAQALAFLEQLSQFLLEDARCKDLPMFRALGFWLRRSALRQLQARFAAGQSDGTLTVPAGLVFHIPPANVDTMFVYSWALALLLGNRNILRLPGRGGPALDLLAQLVGQALAGHPAIAARTALIRYPHDPAVTAALSAAADLRVIWGGDRAVQEIRAASLAPQGRKLVFPNRFSLSLIRLGHWQLLDEAARLALVEHFYNDLYWFDQRACASPRLLLWHGEEMAARHVHKEFTALLVAAARRRGWQLDIGGAANRQAALFGIVLDVAVQTVAQSSELISLWMLPEALPAWRAHAEGGGVLAGCAVADPAAMIPLLTRQDQTLTYAGYEAGAMESLARSINGRGIDRMVPIGQALTFDALWDGYDLLAAFGRKVKIA